jgi:Peroxisomal biogenesis factor 11 (PEX11)
MSAVELQPHDNSETTTSDDPPTATTTTADAQIAVTTKLPPPHWTDRWLIAYCRFVSRSSNQDKVLKLLQWTLYMSSIGLQQLIVQQKRNKDATTTQYDDRQALRCTNNHRDVVSALRKLSSEIGMARYVARILGFPTAVEGWRNESWSIDTDPRRIYKYIGYLLSGSMVFYYPTELLAYTHWVAPQLYKESSPRTGNYWSYVSCRCWVLYIIAELTQGLLRWKELREQIQSYHHSVGVVQQQLSSTKCQIGPTSNDDETVTNQTIPPNVQQQQQQQQHDRTLIDNSDHGPSYDDLIASYNDNKLQVCRNVLFLFPCLHFSLPHWDTKPWLSERTTNTLLWFESIVGMYQAIVDQKR